MGIEAHHVLDKKPTDARRNPLVQKTYKYTQKPLCIHLRYDKYIPLTIFSPRPPNSRNNNSHAHPNTYLVDNLPKIGVVGA